MKRLLMLVLVLTLAIGVVGCQSSTDHLAAIKEAGKVVVGTSADYPPFEFVDEAGNTTGFDVELMNEIGKRMGVTVEWTDMPFDSLIAAVQEGKIDMSIAAFNYDEERDKTVDFSDPYYTTEDSFVVLDGFTGDLSDPMNLANFTVGAQSGTVQDGWITDNLVTPGLLPAEKYFTYERVDQAALDLQAGRIEVLMADYVPAQAVVSQYGGMKIVYHGVLSTGPLNIVLPEGDTNLKNEVNRILKEMQDDGFVDQLAVKYFSE
ncbi:MAG TPA: ABC transporter substrate-binding protein [Anaerolineaceae bacterium]|nr:amino acid ABC transporter substrate-binding protein [Anaerolineaceae bacterium]HOV05931.1 ABC transporter substrate-binding protein [Anaerolineaceae bacterium]